MASSTRKVKHMAHNTKALEVDFIKAAHRIGHVLQNPAVQKSAQVMKDEVDQPGCSFVDITRAVRSMLDFVSEVITAYQDTAPISRAIAPS